MTTDPTPASPTPRPSTPPAATTTTTPPAAPEPPPRKRGGKLKWVVLVILVLLIIGGVVLYMNLNSIVRSTVEKQSTASLNVNTDLEAANVSLLGQSVSLRNFQVSQPQGFGDAAMMSLGGIDVDVSVNELRQDPLRVGQITIRQPRLVIEMKGKDFNIKKFIDQLPPGEDKPVEGEEPMKLIINDLQIRGATVVFRPDLAMQNVGTGEGNQNGAEVKEIVTLLVSELSAKATQSEQLPPELRQLLSLNVADITNLAKQKLGEEVNKQLGRVTEELKANLPPDAAQAVEGILKDPNAALKDPGKAIEKGLGDIIAKRTSPTTTASTGPAATTAPSDVKQDATKAIEKGLGDLLKRK